MQRFLASDVIYEDSFKGPATQALEKDDITGIEVPGAPALPAERLLRLAGRRQEPHPRPVPPHGDHGWGDGTGTSSGNLRAPRSS